MTLKSSLIQRSTTSSLCTRKLTNSTGTDSTTARMLLEVRIRRIPSVERLCAMGAMSNVSAFPRVVWGVRRHSTHIGCLYLMRQQRVDLIKIGELGGTQQDAAHEEANE